MFSSFIISQGLFEDQIHKMNSLLPVRFTPEQIDFLLVHKAPDIPDLIFLQPETSIGIEDIRRLEKEIKLKPYSHTHKVIILNEAHLLTLEAQNALLKTLEEPPDYLLIFLLTPDEDLLLSTIRSRCQIVRLQNKNPTLTPEELTDMKDNFLKIIRGGIGERLKNTEEVSKTREDAVNFLNQSLIFCQQLLISPEKYLSFIDLTRQEVITIIYSIQRAKELISINIHTRLVLDNMFLGWPKL